MEKITVKLVGTDGNAFGVIGRVRDALRKAGLREEASKFQREALKQPSYDALLQLVLETVEVE